MSKYENMVSRLADEATAEKVKREEVHRAASEERKKRDQHIQEPLINIVDPEFAEAARGFSRSKISVMLGFAPGDFDERYFPAPNQRHFFVYREHNRASHSSIYTFSAHADSVTLSRASIKRGRGSNQEENVQIEKYTLSSFNSEAVQAAIEMALKELLGIERNS